MSRPPSSDDRDLVSIGEARAAARTARAAQVRLGELSQSQIDTLVERMADAAAAEAGALARLAVDETGYGVVDDKVQKNLFAARRVHEFIRPMKTVGVVRRLPDQGVVEIAEPFGVVAGVIPCTNPTSTTIYKILIAIKARCAIVLSPHPSAVSCITQTATLMTRAGLAAGLPEGSITCLQTVTLEGTQALMGHRDVAVILATGGLGLVRAAYSAGKPAYGVGPGNAPAYVDRSADVAKAVRDIVTGKTFDHGVLCSSENSVVVDRPIADEARRQFVGQRAHFLSPAERDAVARVLVTSRPAPNPDLVGKSAEEVARAAGLEVPAGTRVLIAELEGVGRAHPLSIEKLCPVLSWYVVDGWREGCARCKEILAYGGMGHTMSIHATDEQIVLEFGLQKPASRICVNTPTTLGSIGLTTGLDPAMTLGCGGFGGNITSDNISPRHLLNIKRLAYEIRPSAEARIEPQASPAPPPASAGIDQTTLAQRIDDFLSSRGVRRAAPDPAPPPPEGPPGQSPGESGPPPPAAASPELSPSPAPTHGTPDPAPDAPQHPAEFVCEDDVRQALEARRTILVNERTIVTPSARDLAERHDLLRYLGVSDRRHRL